MEKEVEMYPGAKEATEKKELDPIEQTAEQHTMMEELIADLNEKYKTEMAKHVTDKDVEVNLTGEQFINIINLLVSLKEHNHILRSFINQSIHLMKQDDIKVMGVLGGLMKKWASLDIEGKLVDAPEVEVKED